MGEKVTTIMVLKVDLQCHRCYKKVKKVLCKFPQIQDQIYDEKQNTVTIKVVCCSPEKIKQKIICKGGDCIQSIKIKPPPKPPPPPPEPAPPKPPEPAPPKPPEPAPPKPPEPAPPKPPEPAPPKPPEPAPPKPPKPVPPPAFPCHPIVVPCYPLGPPIGVLCCRPCYEGCGCGPCSHCQGEIPPWWVRPAYDSYGGGGYKPCYVSRCDYYGEENSSGCTIM